MPLQKVCNGKLLRDSNLDVNKLVYYRHKNACVEHGCYKAQ